MDAPPLLALSKLSVEADDPSDDDGYVKEPRRLPLPRANPFDRRLSIQRFLQSYTCYDVLPASSKLVVFDANIPMRLAYFALVEHDIRSAPLWDPERQSLLGVVTVTDFVHVLRHGFVTGELSEVIDGHSIRSWKELVSSMEIDDVQEEQQVYQAAKDNDVKGVEAARRFARERRMRTPTMSKAAVEVVENHFDSHDEERVGKVRDGIADDRFVFAGPDDSLYDACRILKTFGIHRLPVLDQDSNNCLAVLTHRAVLDYLVSHFRESRRLYDKSILSLKIGTFSKQLDSTYGRDLCFVHPSAPLKTVLDKLVDHSVSCIPVVKPDTLEVVDLFARTYVCYLARSEKIEECAETAVIDILNGQYEVWGNDRGELELCLATETVQEVFVRFAKRSVHRLVVVDSLDSRRLRGVCSLSDLLGYFL